MAQTLMSTINQQLKSRWTPVIEGSIPVEWLYLLESGQIQVVHENAFFEWDQRDPVLSMAISDWKVRKPPGDGQQLSLSHAEGCVYQFKFNQAQRSWFFAVSRQETCYTEYVDHHSDNVAQGTGRQANSAESDAKKECRVATPLFDHGRRSEYTLGGIDGSTFFADGTFNYRGETFGRDQAIDFVDPELETEISREPGRSKTLKVYEPQSNRTYRFRYNSTIEHPICRRWYRLSTRPNPRLTDRITAAWQRAEADSFAFRMVVWALLGRSGYAAGVGSGFSRCWPVC